MKYIKNIKKIGIFSKMVVDQKVKLLMILQKELIKLLKKLKLYMLIIGRTWKLENVNLAHKEVMYSSSLMVISQNASSQDGVNYLYRRVSTLLWMQEDVSTHLYTWRLLTILTFVTCDLVSVASYDHYDLTEPALQ